MIHPKRRKSKRRFQPARCLTFKNKGASLWNSRCFGLKAWPGFETALPPGFRMVEASRLLALEAFVSALNGETKKALESVKTIGDMSVHFSRCPYLVSALYSGRLIQSKKIALERILALSPELDNEGLPV